MSWTFIKIASIAEQPIAGIPFLNAGKGTASFYVDRLPFLVAKTDSLPPDLDAIIATADLQGREGFEETKGGPPRLLGEVLPQRLCDEILPGLGIRAEQTLLARQMIEDAYAAGSLQESSFAHTSRRQKQWKALFATMPKGDKLYDLVESLRRSPDLNPRDRLLRQLNHILEALPESGRAVLS